MNRLVAQWNAFWFPQTTAVRLAICRIVMVAAQLLLFLPSLENNLRMAETNSSFAQPQAIIGWLSAVVSQDILRSPQLLTCVYYSCIVSGVMALIGLLTRPAAFVFAAANSYLVLHQYSYGNRHHPEAVFCIFLMLLAFCRRSIGARPGSCWPLRRETQRAASAGRLAPSPPKGSRW